MTKFDITADEVFKRFLDYFMKEDKNKAFQSCETFKKNINSVLPTDVENGFNNSNNL